MRILDVFISGIMLIVLAPFFCMIALILRCTGEGEIFYRQERIGYEASKFKVIKFATMMKNSPNMGSGTITSKNDVRILPVGRFLRKTKINELPQLFNILFGDMSLIGPRPHAERDLRGILGKDRIKISSLKPGLSGVGSLVFRNEEEILTHFEEPRHFYDTVIAPYKASLEIWYVDNRNIRLNIYLIALTAYVVISGRTNVLFSLYPSLPVIPNELAPYLE